MKEKFAKLSLVFVALAVPLALFIGTALGYALKAINPSNVDITADLAYLGTALTAGYGTLALFLLLGFIGALIGFKNGHQKTAKATLLTILLIIVCVVGAAVAQKMTTKVEQDYTKQQVKNLYNQLQLDIPKK